MIVTAPKAQLTTDILANFVEWKIVIVNAAMLRKKSCRTVERYLRRYRVMGIQFVVYQNTGKPLYNNTCDRTKLTRYDFEEEQAD